MAHQCNEICTIFYLKKIDEKRTNFLAQPITE